MLLCNVQGGRFNNNNNNHHQNQYPRYSPRTGFAFHGGQQQHQQQRPSGGSDSKVGKYDRYVSSILQI